VDLWTKPKFRRNHIGGLQSVKIRRIFRGGFSASLIIFRRIFGGSKKYGGYG